MFNSPVANSLDLLFAHNSTCRIVGITKEDSASFISHCFFQICDRGNKAVFQFGFYRYRLSAC